jgi:16S rRNA (cytosine1402-N4)-methyltransferase
MVLLMDKKVHIPVLANEAVELLNVQPGCRYVDCTVGLGGHALAILKKSGSTGRLLGIDADPEAINSTEERLGKYSGQVILINDNFSNLYDICKENDFIPVDGILFDLGFSSLQIDSQERGFSFKSENDLDMRFSPEQELTAMDIVNTFTEAALSKLIWEYGEETKSRQIAANIMRNRPVTSAVKLSQVIEQTTGGHRGRIHPATRTFQALRIAVNDELGNLEKALEQAVNCLSSGGRIVVISYHSLEDRIVKQFIKRESSECICPADSPVCICNHIPLIKIIEKKIITPSLNEIRNNPRSRSAKLRVVERI